MHFINIGYGNIANATKVISIVSPDAAPIKRLIQTAKDEGRAVDATCGRRTRSVLIMEDNKVILSALLPETILNRCQNTDIE